MSLDLSGITEDTLRARGGVKWGIAPEGVIPVWLAETDFPVAASIRQALRDAVDRGALGYPLPPASLGESYAAYARSTSGLDVDPTWVRAIGDVMEGVHAGCLAALQPGDEVVVWTPSYPATRLKPVEWGYRVREVPMIRTETTWLPDLEATRRAFEGGAKAMLLIQPHNPTGRVFTREELTELSQIVEEHHGVVVSDEVFAPCTWDGHISYASISPEAAAHCFTSTSAVKGWGTSGLRCALVMAHTAERDAQLGGLGFGTYASASSLGMVATEAAFRDAEYRTAMVAQIRDNAVWLEDQLAEKLPELAWRRPEATYLAWLDARPYGTVRELLPRLQEAGVMPQGGEPYGAGSQDFLRFTFATTPALLEMAVDRLTAALHR